VKGKAGLYPELKVPEIYAGRNVEFEKMVAEILARNDLSGPNADPKTPVILQTFSEVTVRNLAAMKLGVPVVYLVEARDMERWARRATVEAVKATGASGLGPSKSILLKYPQVVKWAHELGLTVTPYTFRSRDPGAFRSVRDEMMHFLYNLDVDALFTDNPDQFPRH
jgi:glycerophosphoryl diester phosphodiesterase